MPPHQLTAIHVYPIKSAAGIAASQWELDQFGLQYDRRWMVVNPAGHLITQRTHPRLALVRPSLADHRLLVEAPGQSVLQLSLTPLPAVATTAVVHGDACDAVWLGEEPARWFSQFLDCPCSLVYMSEETVRPADPAYAADGVRVSFADAFPFLLLSEESLADLNTRLAQPVPMNRFRPNLVASGGGPYWEDALGDFSIGAIGFRAVKPCARCVLTTTDQATAARGPEPLRTLSTYRKQGSGVLFGQNLVHRGRGRLTVGDSLRM
jgi:MOSC domain-containing protein